MGKQKIVATFDKNGEVQLKGVGFPGDQCAASLHDLANAIGKIVEDIPHEETEGNARQQLVEKTT